jgi:hypothetical protein
MSFGGPAETITLRYVKPTQSLSEAGALYVWPSLRRMLTFLSDGYYGLFLDDVLQDGSSAPCPTFDNVSLCSTTESSTKKSVPFECVGVEVWAIGN